MFEKMGVPTAPIVTLPFADVVKRVAYNLGVPNLRFTFTPHPIAGVTAETCRKYILGNDPVTHLPLVTENIDALTKPPFSYKLLD
jgi:hypothetical protein